MAYDFVYTDELEKACRKTLGSNLKEYEANVKKNVLENKGAYNTLKSRYDGSEGIFDNLELLNKFGVASEDIFNTLRRYSTLSYSIGGSHAYRDFSINKKFNISSSGAKDINSYAYSSHLKVTNLYNNLMKKYYEHKKI